MWSATNPISHHTSHTMGNGAASSGNGGNSNGTDSIRHHTSHTMENGASSSNQGAHGDGDREGSVLGASLTCPVADPTNDENNTNDNNDLTKDNTVPELGQPGQGEIPEAGEPCSADSIASDSEDDSDGINTAATSMRSSCNLANFSIIDSTLREGEQFATAHYTTEQKLQIARALDDFGVEYIEVTSPAASEQSRLDCEAICKLGLRAKVLCHIRCNMDDARIAVQTGVDGINMCIGTSKQLMTHSHGKDLDWIAEKAKEIIAYVRSNNIEIRFSGEDSFRSDFNEIVKLYSLMDRLGADRVGIADTVGGATWREVYDKISTLRQFVDCDIETHFHNDTGCAVSNAFVALEAGATHIDTCVLGIGERNGITPLGALLASLIHTDRKYIVNKYNIEKLPALERLIADIVGVEIPFNTPVLSLEESE